MDNTDISSATENLFMPFRGLFEFGKRKPFSPPDSVGTGLCLSGPDVTPFVILKNYSCPLHFYCPNTTSPSNDPLSVPSVCPPTLECQLMRLSSHFCPPQGVYEPEPCTRGFYCPNPSNKTICPDGTFCPTGTIEPKPCYPFSFCPEGSAYQTFFGGLIMCLVIDFILVSIFALLKFRKRCQDRKRVREESRKLSGRSIAVIAETTHSKKRANFLTLSNQDEIQDNSSVNKVQIRKKSSFWRALVKLINPKPIDRNNSDVVPNERVELNEVVCNDDSEIDRISSFEDDSIEIASSPTETRAPSIHRRNVSLDLNGVVPRMSVRTTSTAIKHYSLHLNDLLMGYHRAQDGADLSLTFDFDSLSLTLNSGKTILNGVTGRIVPGKVTVIMGPSGAGKSTFMNVLMGKIPRTGGRLLINGLEVEMHLYKKLIGYVPQDDVMLYELTVRENILYSAQCRLPKSWCHKEVNKFVDAVLEALDLSHVQNNLISSVSGGQRKRVNIGMELVTCPSAIFLDEPTSGLDSTAALKVANTMKKIATTIGITVVAVVHQPRFEIFEEFDDVLMIAPGGQTAYLGPREDIATYFENQGFIFPPKNNPADILMDIIGGKGHKLVGEQYEDYEVMDLVNVWKSEQRFEEFPEPPEDVLPGPNNIVVDRIVSLSVGTLKWNARRPSDDTPEALELSKSHLRLQSACIKRGSNFWMQLLLAHNRACLQQYRLVNSFLLEIAVASIAGVIIGLAVSMYDGSLYQGLLIYPFTLISPSPIELVVPMLSLIVCCTIGLSGAPAGVKIFSEEREIYFREASAGLNRFSYYIGKNFAATYRFLVSCLHFTSLFHFFARPNSYFVPMYIIHLSVFYAVYGLSFVCAMVVKRENASMISVCAALVFSVLCGSGPSITDMEKIHLAWILDMSYARWATEAWYSMELMVFDGVYEIWNVSSKLFGYTLQRYWFDIFMILVLGSGFRVLGLLLMLFTQRQRQR